MDKNIKLSIIIPYYNGESFYGKLLYSIEQALVNCRQFNFGYELITIIDSMETVEAEVLQTTTSIFQNTENITVLIKKNSKNMGVAVSRNVALDIARGEFLHIIDQDDQVHQSFYAVTLPILQNYNFVMVNGIAHYISKRYNSHQLLYFTPDLSIKGLLKDDFIRSPGQIIFDKSLTKEIRFPESKNFKGADDRFFWLNIFLRYEKTLTVRFIKKPLYFAFIHDNNFSSDTINLRRSSLENWKILLSEFDTSKYKRLIESDILSLKFAAREEMNLLDKILGAYHRFFYFLDINKLVRFYFKRIKPLSKKPPLH